MTSASGIIQKTFENLLYKNINIYLKLNIVTIIKALLHNTESRTKLELKDFKLLQQRDIRVRLVNHEFVDIVFSPTSVLGMLVKSLNSR